MHRRHALKTLSAFAALAALPRFALAKQTHQALVGAAWRGPKPGDPYFAGTLAADWDTLKVNIRYAVPLPGRAHDVLATPDGGLIVAAYRFGNWILRCDSQGKVMQRINLGSEGKGLSCGHATYSPDGKLVYVTGDDMPTRRGRIVVRDADTLKKLDEWDTGGTDPHQVVIDHEGHLYVGNGGVLRKPENDQRLDLATMDSSLTKLDGRTGHLLDKWQLDDRRLSLRHMAWSKPSNEAGALLGIGLQAEHDDEATRLGAPILAVFDGKKLTTPTHVADGKGYSGNVAPAHRGGFMLTSTSDKAMLWHPGIPEKLATVVDMKETYALAPWPGSDSKGGSLIATAIGLVRWHPTDKSLILPWPQPMALDNHWVLIAET